MELVRALLQSDPSCPRVTVYDESTGARLDFSAVTLDNWAAKIANMLVDEFDCDSESTIVIDVPAGWQSVVIVLGALAAGVNYTVGSALDEDAAVWFTSPDVYDRRADEAAAFGGDVALVTGDPFGRGVEETGGELPLGTVDFGSTVRVYGDQFYVPGVRLDEVVDPSAVPAGARVISPGFATGAQLVERVLCPLAAGGSAVLVVGATVSADRMAEIAAAENATVTIGVN